MSIHRQTKRGPSPAWRGAGALLVLALSLALFQGCAMLDTAPQYAARSMGDDAVKAMGGRSALDTLRFLKFDFVIEVDGKETARRFHTWDREAGRARVEGTLPDGRAILALLNLKAGTGRVFLGTQPHIEEINDPQALQLCATWQAQAAWWLLGPTMLRERGVIASEEPPVEIDSISLPTIAVTFLPSFGPLAQDRYWFHLDPKTNLPYASSFVLGDELTAQTTVIWKKWETLHDFQLPTRFVIVRSRRIIGIDRLSAPEWIDADVFESPVLPVVVDEEEPSVK